jgi:ubiquinone/menaquinone biosynthesis C-methylase UbiE
VNPKGRSSNRAARAAARDIVDLYERHARDFDADRGAQLGGEKAWLDRFVKLLPIGATTVDLGCGSGEPIARYLIGRGLSVTGVDSSPTLISLCQARFPSSRWIVADMRALRLGEQFKGILAWDSFFHLSGRDQTRMFAVFKRHAAPGAALMFTSGHRNGEIVGSYRGDPLYHASLSTREYRSLLKAKGFRVVAHVVDDADCGGHTVWLAQRD